MIFPFYAFFTTEFLLIIAGAFFLGMIREFYIDLNEYNELLKITRPDSKPRNPFIFDDESDSVAESDSDSDSDADSERNVIETDSEDESEYEEESEIRWEAEDDSDPDYIPSESEEETDEETDAEEQNTTDASFTIPVKGDIVRIRFRSMEQGDFKEGTRRLGRAISNYGCRMIEPEEGTLYKVVNIYEDSPVPNAKGNGKMKRVSKMMSLYPEEKSVVSKERDSVGAVPDAWSEVFWYIDLDDYTICQYEDGFPLYKLTEINVC